MTYLAVGVRLCHVLDLLECFVRETFAEGLHQVEQLAHRHVTSVVHVKCGKRLQHRVKVRSRL